VWIPVRSFGPAWFVPGLHGLRPHSSGPPQGGAVLLQAKLALGIILSRSREAGEATSTAVRAYEAGDGAQASSQDGLVVVIPAACKGMLTEAR